MSTIKGWLGRPWAFCQPRNRPNKISTAAVWQWHQIRKIWTSGSVHPFKRKTSSILSYFLGYYYLLLSVGNSSVQSLHPMREIRHCSIDRRRWTWNTIGNQKIELVSVVQTSHSAVKFKKNSKMFPAHTFPGARPSCSAYGNRLNVVRNPTTGFCPLSKKKEPGRVLFQSLLSTPQAKGRVHIFFYYKFKSSRTKPTPFAQ